MEYSKEVGDIKDIFYWKNGKEVTEYGDIFYWKNGKLHYAGWLGHPR